MPVKRPEILSREDFAEALREARVTVAEVAKATGVPRTYMSEFRNGDRQLRPEMLAKLREFFEAKGIEFEPEPDPEGSFRVGPGDTPKPGTVTGRYAARPGVAFLLPVDAGLPRHVVDTTLDAMEEADARLVEVLKKPAARKNGFWEDGTEFTEDTAKDLQEAFALMAAGYARYLKLTGFRGLRGPEGTDQAETIGAVVFQTFQGDLAKLGLAVPSPIEGEAEQEEETAE